MPDIETLEVMRLRATVEHDRRLIEWELVVRKREVKASCERLERGADFFDKVALPTGAALPALVTLLASEHLLVDPIRRWAALSSALVGAVAWLACRVASYRLAAKARMDLARLGKVD